jgi:hypothetical protein
MNITFIPQRRDEALLLSVSADTVTINGVEYDFSVIPEGASLSGAATDSQHIIGDISREGGALSLTVILPHGENPSLAVTNPAPAHVTEGVVVDTANSVYPWSLA